MVINYPKAGEKRDSTMYSVQKLHPFPLLPLFLFPSLFLPPYICAVSIIFMSGALTISLSLHGRQVLGTCPLLVNSISQQMFDAYHVIGLVRLIEVKVPKYFLAVNNQVLHPHCTPHDQGNRRGKNLSQRKGMKNEARSIGIVCDPMCSCQYMTLF